jgi:hypothetical protein
LEVLVNSTVVKKAAQMRDAVTANVVLEMDAIVKAANF